MHQCLQCYERVFAIVHSGLRACTGFITFEYLSELYVVTVRLRTGPGTEDKHAASVRADTPVPPDCGLYYYEVTVINRGRDGFIGARPVCLDGQHFPLHPLCVPPLLVPMLCSALLPDRSVLGRGRGTR